MYMDTTCRKYRSEQRKQYNSSKRRVLAQQRHRIPGRQ